MRFKVELNGTNENPYHRFGLSQNPFPQIAKHEFAQHMLQIQKLGGDPIPNTQYIRDTLKGFTNEFINGCCEHFIPGQYVTFEMEYPDET
jgi:hypothetical protein